MQGSLVATPQTHQERFQIRPDQAQHLRAVVPWLHQHSMLHPACRAALAGVEEIRSVIETSRDEGKLVARVPRDVKALGGNDSHEDNPHGSYGCLRADNGYPGSYWQLETQ